MLTFLLFFSCGNKNKPTPENLIEEKQMVKVIAELELTQAFIKINIAKKDSIDHATIYQNVLKKFNITQEQFNTSLVHYSNDPQQIEHIYNEAITYLSEKQATFRTNSKNN